MSLRGARAAQGGRDEPGVPLPTRVTGSRDLIRTYTDHQVKIDRRYLATWLAHFFASANPR